MLIENIPLIRDVWAGRQIIKRFPHAIPGEAFVQNNEIPAPLLGPPGGAAPTLGQRVQNAYVHERELPFEIQAMELDTTPCTQDDVTGVRLAANPVVSQSLYIDQQNLLDASVIITIWRDAGRGENFIRTPYRCAIAFNPETGIWELDEPYVIPPGKGIMIAVQGDGTGFTSTVVFDFNRVAITLLGELLALGPRVS